MKRKFKDNRTDTQFEWFNDSVNKALIYILSGVALAGIVVSSYLLIDNKNQKESIKLLEEHKSLSDTLLILYRKAHKLDSITISQMPPVEYLDFKKRQGK